MTDSFKLLSGSNCYFYSGFSLINFVYSELQVVKVGSSKPTSIIILHDINFMFGCFFKAG